MILLRSRAFIAATTSRPSNNAFLQHRIRATTASTTTRNYFTNTEEMKKDDPYATLGLQYGDATSTADIKQAFRIKARELHPDVNTTDKPEVALKKFQQLQKAYQIVLGNCEDAQDGAEEWRFAAWRKGDRIAQDRTDVAGASKKRPIQPASKANVWAARQIGHPDGKRGVVTRRGEYLGEGGKSQKPSSSVGTGQNKWVTPKAFTPWNNPEATQQVRASNFAAAPATTTADPSSQPQK